MIEIFTNQKALVKNDQKALAKNEIVSKFKICKFFWLRQLWNPATKFCDERLSRQIWRQWSRYFQPKKHTIGVHKINATPTECYFVFYWFFEKNFFCENSGIFWKSWNLRISRESPICGTTMRMQCRCVADVMRMKYVKNFVLLIFFFEILKSKTKSKLFLNESKKVNFLRRHFEK